MLQRCDAQMLLEASFEDLPLTDEQEIVLNELVPEGQGQDFYKGMLSAMVLCHAITAEAQTMDDLAVAMTTMRLVGARAANRFID